MKNIFDGKLNAKEELMADLSQLGTGVYLYKIFTTTSQTSIKFVKE